MPAPPTTYSVGPGILARMTDRSDTPATDEIYSGTGGQFSEAIGTSGTRYVWVKSTNTVYVYPPAACP